MGLNGEFRRHVDTVKRLAKEYSKERERLIELWERHVVEGMRLEILYGIDIDALLQELDNDQA